MALKKVLVTGVTGQVGSYLAEMLLSKNYDVHGLDRRKSVSNHDNIKNIVNKITIIEGDITDASSMNKIIRGGQYGEIYNLAAQSHVKTSFEQPMQTLEVNSTGVANILEAIRWGSPKSKLYHASTSELYGPEKPPQNERTPFHPRSPYGVAKLSAHALVVNYRESYGLKLSCGIMFNTESPRRGKLFVTRKITEWVKAYYKDRSTPSLELGNLDAKRDWTHALDSIEAIYKICNQDEFDTDFSSWSNYCFGTGVAHSVRDFITIAMVKKFGLKTLEERFEFKESGIDEYLWDKYSKTKCITINPEYFRPSEVDYLLSDPALIKARLGWSPKYSLADIVSWMLEEDEGEKN